MKSVDGSQINNLMLSLINIIINIQYLPCVNDAGLIQVNDQF